MTWGEAARRGGAWGEEVLLSLSRQLLFQVPLLAVLLLFTFACAIALACAIAGPCLAAAFSRCRLLPATSCTSCGSPMAVSGGGTWARLVCCLGKASLQLSRSGRDSTLSGAAVQAQPRGLVCTLVLTARLRKPAALCVPRGGGFLQRGRRRHHRADESPGLCRDTRPVAWVKGAEAGSLSARTLAAGLTWRSALAEEALRTAKLFEAAVATDCAGMWSSLVGREG
jgi:hypothetical protein